MPNALLNMVEANAPDTPALMEIGRPDATYGDLVRQTRQHMAFLTFAGAGTRMRFATMLTAGADTGVFLLACCCAGTALPNNPALADAEVIELAREAGATHFVADSETAPRGRQIAAALGIPLIMLTTDADGVAGSARAALDGEAFAIIGDPSASFDRDPSETALVLLTSGSTSRPKRVPLSLANVVAGSQNISGSLELVSSDIVLAMMPMSHVGGIVDIFTAVFASGGAVALARQVSADSFFANLLAFRPTWFQGVPTVLADIARRGANPDEMQAMKGLKFIRAVAQPLLNGLHLSFEKQFGVPLVPMYGMTEATGVITSPRPSEKIRVGSVGRPFGTEVTIADQYGNPAKTGEIGEIMIFGPAITAGYEDIDRAEFFRGKWLRTGDQGYFGPDGVLTLVGRIKEIINKGGEKISPLEIERAATMHPAIAEIAAFALPHPSLGEEVAVAVVPHKGKSISLTELQTVLRGSLAEYKLPRSLLLVDALPRVPNGKLNRRALPALAMSGSPQPTAKTPPSTPTEKLLATLWADVLEGEKPFLEDDFFELGGDSLSATNLATLVESRFKGISTSNDLFVAPTLAEMAKRIDAGLVASQASTLRPDIEQALRKAVISWRGTHHTDTVAVSRNAMGDKTPFFWICQSNGQFEPLCEHMSPDRPIYILSSLSTTNLKNAANTAVLARHYASWIASKTGTGPIHIGGFCQGGLVAFHVSKLLEAMGRRPEILCVQDRFVAEQYEGAVALFSGKRGFTAFYDRFGDPARGWGRYWQGPLSLHRLDADHNDLHKQPHVATFAAQLESVLDAVEQGRPMPGLLKFEPPAPFDPALRAVVAETRLPRFMRAGSSRRLTVRVRNNSNVPLAPTAESGVSLAAEWRGFDPVENIELGGRTSIDRAIPPGGHIDIELDIRMPVRGLPLRLTVDLVEDGIAWFNEHRRARSRGFVIPLPAL
ncbi:MAG: AMP-binding protein [Mesorhizobium sp.]